MCFLDILGFPCFLTLRDKGFNGRCVFICVLYGFGLGARVLFEDTDDGGHFLPGLIHHIDKLTIRLLAAGHAGLMKNVDFLAEG